MAAKDMFQVGETLVIQRVSNFPLLFGLECVVNKNRATWEDKVDTSNSVFGYSVTTLDGLMWIIPESCLIRKSPQRGDMDAKVAWGIGPWTPNAEGVRIAEEMVKSGPWRL